MSYRSSRTERSRLLIMVGGVFLLSGALFPRSAEGKPTAEPTPQDIFERRIMPIFKSPNPSSCTQCHLAGVELKNYILPSHEKTFLSLRDQGLIDLDKPAESKILRLINMGEQYKQGAALIQEKVRKAEYEAFAEWIRASCNDPKLRSAPRLETTDLAKPPRPAEVIRHARKDKLLQAFEKTIWSLRFRCDACHMPGGPENSRLVQKDGARVSWIKKEGAEATMNYLLASNLIDVKKPERSLLLLKPLNEVKHGGGQKMLPGDDGYKAFRSWLEDYAAIVNDKYAAAAGLPRPPAGPETFGSQHWLKFSDTPPAWGDKLLRVTVHTWNAQEKAWNPEPIAFADRGVWGRGKLWQHNLILAAEPGSMQAREWQRKPALAPARYLVKVYVDQKGRLATDWKSPLGKEDFVGQVEVNRWTEGYGSMVVIKADQVRR